MTNEPKSQGQHRISRVYLKQFGFKKKKQWYISVWRKGLDHTEIESVETFSKETNIFDLPFEDIEAKRHFENTSSIIEGEYGKVIKMLRSQNQLIPRHRELLCHYVANLICRAKHSRDFFDLLITENDTRLKFLNEITMFEKEEALPELKILLSILEIESRLNLIIGILMTHLVHVFKAFNFIVLKDFNNRGWFTSDNPVVIDKQNNYSWIIPWEAEIYFPLSKNYCLFMYHKAAEIKYNSLRNLPSNEVAISDEATHSNICNRILHNQCDYVIFPGEIEETNFNDISTS